MSLQFIHDNRGNTTGVFIPIEEWQVLKDKYVELQKEEAQNSMEIPDWHKKIIDDCLTDYYANPSKVSDFDKTIDEIEQTL